MEIIKIGNDAMKISLCTNEAEECGFSGEKTQQELKNNFIKLLLRAKGVVDFKVASEKLMGEMFSAKDGGCDIFVSRVEVSETVYKEKFAQEVTKKFRQAQTALCFDEIEQAVSVAKILDRTNYTSQSALYFDNSGEKYYILLEDVYTKDIKFACLTEYSTQIKSNYIPYIREHYKCICKRDAVKCLAKC